MDSRDIVEGVRPSLVHTDSRIRCLHPAACAPLCPHYLLNSWLPVPGGWPTRTPKSGYWHPGTRPLLSQNVWVARVSSLPEDSLWPALYIKIHAYIPPPSGKLGHANANGKTGGGGHALPPPHAPSPCAGPTFQVFPAYLPPPHPWGTQPFRCLWCFLCLASILFCFGSRIDPPPAL
jgi:hypothetical protein